MNRFLTLILLVHILPLFAWGHPGHTSHFELGWYNISLIVIALIVSLTIAYFLGFKDGYSKQVFSFFKQIIKK
ncbi:MAG: hypothetical protein ABFS32_10345 [Bacteroidota bacterium]